MTDAIKAELEAISRKQDEIMMRLDKYDAILTQVNDLVEQARPHMSKVGPLLDEFTQMYETFKKSPSSFLSSLLMPKRSR